MKQISRVVSVFHDRLLPDQGCTLVGYGALIEAYNLQVPLPEKLAIISQRHKRYGVDCWDVYTPRHKPADTLVGHLVFALKYEGIDLLVLKELFKQINPGEIVAWVYAEPTSSYSRRIWFFYEWLMGGKLDIPDAKTGNFVDALNPKQQYAGKSDISRRHRVRNNLPGGVDFCPLVRVTEKLKEHSKMNISFAAHELVNKARRDILVRASAFLLLKDSRASFQIEQENPTQSRAERWGQELGLAGRHTLSKEEILRLQSVVLEDSRFVALGLRTEGGFIGVHDRASGDPLPDHISARAQDLDRLLDGIIALSEKSALTDPIILAAMISFGFVFIHPLFDGNGRIHRYLIQQVLSKTDFFPSGIVFPVSAAILGRISEYKEVLEAYSQPRLKFIQWRSTDRGNVEVLNETLDLYRYFDATKQAEFLYDCVALAVLQGFPEEIDYLERYDKMRESIKKLLQMPDARISLLIRFLEQNHGVLSQRDKNEEFKALSPEECQKIEELYVTIFSK